MEDLLNMVLEESDLEWGICQEADINGTSLVQMLTPELQRVVQEMPFPKDQGTPRSGGWVDDPERGYDGSGWTFKSPTDGTVMHCYRRWGCMRVGCRKDGRVRVTDFILFLYAKGTEMGITGAVHNGQ